jgi:hypothetical protein
MKNSNDYQITFDTILENKIGLGSYQWVLLFFLCLVDFNDGVELISRY